MVVSFQSIFVLYAILKPSALIIIVFVHLISLEMGITVKVSTTLLFPRLSINQSMSLLLYF